MKRIRRVIWILTIFLQVSFLGIRGVSGGEKLADTELYAKAACLLDGDSGRVLYGKEEDLPLPMASTTKIMTCILVLESGTEDEMATVSSRAAGQPKVHLGVKKGETYRVGDLLYSLMLESHNDTAVILAEHVGTTVEGFAAMMNQKAAEIGCKDTYFITPNGLDASDDQGIHHTTAADLARIMRYCIQISPQKDAFLEITGTSSYTFSDGSGNRTFSCYNHNTFLDMMEGALSGKTGFTADAGYCYVGALERDGKCMIVALLACGWPNHKTYKWSDSRELFGYGLENFVYRRFGEEEFSGREQYLMPIPVTEAQDEELTGEVQLAVELDPEAEGSEGLLMRADEKVEILYRKEKELKAPVKEGTTVGEICYLVDGEIWRRERLYAAWTVEAVDLSWCGRQILKRFLVAFP